MKKESKMKKEIEKKKTVNDIAKELRAIEKHLQVECYKCDETGKPRTKTGKPAKTGKNGKCKDCFGTGVLGYKIDKLFKSIETIKKDVRRIAEDLKAHINRQTAEIRVLPKGHNPDIQGGNSNIKWENGWEDYTGVFFIDPEDEKKIVLEKAKRHFEKYFESGVYHRNRKLGVFLSGGRSGKRLVAEMETD